MNLKRGFKKALLRLVILGVCVALSFLYREKISDIALNTPISEGKSLLELLTESFSSGENAEQMEGLLNVITNILKMVIQIFVFIICFYVLKTVSMIIYWIFSGIITSREKRKVRNSNKVEGNKIDETKVKYEVKKNRKKWFGSLVGIGQGIPTHVWYLVLVAYWLELFHIDVEDAQTIGIAFFRMATHQLHTQANPQNRLLEVFDEGIQLLLAKIIHGCFRFAHSWEDHFISFHQRFFVRSDDRFHSQAFQSIIYRVDIAGIIFYDSYIHLFFL